MWDLNHKKDWVRKNWCYWTVVLEKSIESPLDSKIKPINPKGNQPSIFVGRTIAEAEALIFWPPDANNPLIGKDPDAGKDWRQKEKGVPEDEMVGWHHRLHSSLTWIWANAGRWWRTEESGVLQSMGSQGVRHDLVTEQLWEPASWFIDGHLLTVASHARGEEALWGLCYKGINPVHQGSTLRISSPPNATTLLASNAATLRVRFSTNEL